MYREKLLEQLRLAEENQKKTGIKADDFCTYSRLIIEILHEIELYDKKKNIGINNFEALFSLMFGDRQR